MAGAANAAGVSAWAATAPSDSPEHVSGARGFLYEVTPADGSAARVCLYGTIHLGRPDVAVLSAASANCLVHADRLAVEADLHRAPPLQPLLDRFAAYPAGDSLAQHVPEAVLAHLQRVAPTLGLSEAVLARWRPWMVRTVLELRLLEHAGFSGSLSVEDELERVAAAHSIPVEEIEGTSAQLQLLASEPEAAQVDGLAECLTEIDNGQALAEARTLYAAWRDADPGPVEAELKELALSHRPYDEFLRDEVLDARDITMSERVEAYLREGGTTFFAVGSLHLFSEQGIVAQLRRRGYRVTNLQSN